MLRKSLDEDEKRARLSAVFGILGFVSVPLSFLSIRLWRSAHPLMFGGNTGRNGGGLEGAALQLTLLINFIAYFLLFLTLFSVKVQNERMGEELDDKKYMESGESA
jgi:heme exporter protein C